MIVENDIKIETTQSNFNILKQEIITLQKQLNKEKKLRRKQLWKRK